MIVPPSLQIGSQFTAAQPATTVNVTFKQSVAMSNIPPTPNDPVPQALPLNVLADFAADQRYTLTIDKNQNPGVDFGSVSDVVLAVEYAASLS